MIQFNLISHVVTNLSVQAVMLVTMVKHKDTFQQEYMSIFSQINNLRSTNTSNRVKKLK